MSELAVTVLGVSILFFLPELTVSGFAIAPGNAKPSIDSAFTGDMEPLLSAEVVYDSAEALRLIHDALLVRLPDNPALIRGFHAVARLTGRQVRAVALPFSG